MKTIRILLSLVFIIGMTLNLCSCVSSGTKSESTSVKAPKTETESKQETSSDNDNLEFKVGERWTVDGLFTLKINSVREWTGAYECDKKELKAVYIVDYEYTNIGYKDSNGAIDGLLVDMGEMAVDAKGVLGTDDIYGIEGIKSPVETPGGATCKASVCIGVENPGTFTIHVEISDNDAKSLAAKFVVDPKAEISVNDSSDAIEIPQQTAESENKIPEYKTGETWTVDGFCTLTVKSARETKNINEYNGDKPGAVYIIDYEYKNLGYKDSDGILKGLYLNLAERSVDAKGIMGDDNVYVDDPLNYPEETPIGATCKAQQCIAVENPGTFAIYVTVYDNSLNEQKAKFIVEPEAISEDNDTPSSEKEEVSTESDTELKPLKDKENKRELSAEDQKILDNFSDEFCFVKYYDTEDSQNVYYMKSTDDNCYYAGVSADGEEETISWKNTKQLNIDDVIEDFILYTLELDKEAEKLDEKEGSIDSFDSRFIKDREHQDFDWDKAAVMTMHYDKYFFGFGKTKEGKYTFFKSEDTVEEGDNSAAKVLYVFTLSEELMKPAGNLAYYTDLFKQLLHQNEGKTDE